MFRKGLSNGVSDIRIVNKEEIRHIEPGIDAEAGIYSPSTGIINAHQLMKYFLNKFSDASGGIEPIIYNAEVVGIDKLDDDYKVTWKNSNGDEDTFRTKVLINSAGLNSDEVARMAGVDIDAAGYNLHFCKGEYFRVSAKHKGKVTKLIYPVPDPASLGIHVTLDGHGGIRLGPNAVFMKTNDVDYTVDQAHREEFYARAERFLPFLSQDDLQPDQAGIRPKLYGPNMPERDFVIQEESDKGLPGLINLVGIESPGLTAAPAIGKYVQGMVKYLLTT